MPRFVILRHETPDGYPRGSHWDLMLESAGVLRTWALFGSPDMQQPQTVEALADHRLSYLDTEGEISGGRGTIARWEWGIYERIGSETVPSQVADDLTIDVHGQRLAGTIRLTRLAGELPHWQYSFVPSAS